MAVEQRPLSLCQKGFHFFWDGDGLWVCAKRLESGRFIWPVSENGQVRLRGEEFSALIDGLEVRSKKNWYRL